MPVDPLRHVRPEEGQRIVPLLDRGWLLPTRQEHPLGRLQGRCLGPARLLVLLGPKNSVGARYCRLHLIDGQGRLSRQPLAEGLHNSGPFPAYNWLELARYGPQLQFGGEALDLGATGLDRRLFRLLGPLLPSGGHLMVEYDSPSQQATERLLSRGYPAAATPLGLLLLAAGCLSFRDWYIPEGGREGPRKLQGFKPLDDKAARAGAEATAGALRRVLERPPQPQDPWNATARRLARRALGLLRRELKRGPEPPSRQ